MNAHYHLATGTVIPFPVPDGHQYNDPADIARRTRQILSAWQEAGVPLNKDTRRQAHDHALLELTRR